MQRSKNLAITFLLGAVLVGGALGFTADRVLSNDRSANDSRIKLYDQLELNAAQRATFDSILDDRHRKFNEVLKPVRPQMDSVREKARDAMRTALDAEQLSRFEDILRSQRRSSERRENEK